MQEAPTQQAEAKAPAPQPIQRKEAPAAPAAGAVAARSQSSALVQFSLSAALQRQAETGMASGDVHGTAAAGIGGASGALPHLDAIQMSFGHHDVSSVQAHTDGAAAQASAALGAHGYASGNHVAFADSAPSLHLAAHEAAHVVQQRAGVQLKGAVGQVGDVYERHADAVADKVVAGESAQGLLDQMTPAGASTGAVQAKAVQFDIKKDLRKAMDGWGTDEEAIYGRLRRASSEELQSVVDDKALMKELRGELSHGEMKKVLDLLKAPVRVKLKLAMDGWGTDEAYIHKALATASPEDLKSIAADKKMVARIKSELSGDDLRAVLDRISLPLKGKLQYAIEGWGTDEDYIFTSVAAASIGEITGLLGDAILGQVDADLTEEERNQWRGMLAKRCWEAADGLNSFRFIDNPKLEVRTARLAQMGAIDFQRAMLDDEIAKETDAARFIRAFQSYWAVEIGTSHGATMNQWPMAVLRSMHAQLKALPDQDTRAGFWKKLTLSDHSLIDPTSGNDVGLRNRAAWGAGNFTVGTQAGTGATTEYGYGTKLTAAAAVNDTKITVQEGDRLKKDDVIKIGAGGGAEGGLKITAVSGSDWTLDKKLTKAQTVNADVVPDDGSATRNINWLEATVRHEIAHGVDENLGATVKGFTEGIGGWWTGNYDGWIGAMADPYKTSAATPLTADEKTKIKEAIVDATENQKGSLFGATLGLAATHPVIKYAANNIPVITAAEACLSRGDQFYNSPTAIYREGGKGFSVSFWYKKFMYFNETIVAERVKNYGLYAPTEFFAEAYTVFYEEAGKPGITDADYGRLLRNATWRDWIRTNIHQRGQAPAGTGASGDSPGASPGGASKGKSGGDPGP